MFYYEVATAGNTRGSTSIFTYESLFDLQIGTIVTVKIRNKTCLGFIVKNASKPSFKTNALDTYEPSIVLPVQLVSTFDALRKLYPFSESQLAGLFTPPPAPKKSLQLESMKVMEPQPIPPLNTDQAKAVKMVTSSSANSLLFGDTGTGKTRMYLHLIQDTINSGKNVILLAPEIGLATYLHEEIRAYFPGSILYHSGLTPKERYMAWIKASEAESGMLVVGPRSALSLPLKSIGLIILDEAHDTSYRQDSAPYLHAKVLAAVIAKHHGAKCVYGTATPNIVDYFGATQLNNPIVEIKTRAVQSENSALIKVVDYADETERSAGSLLKSSLVAISEAIKQGGQALVLVNRRGTARYVSCESCGNEERCSVCDHLVVYHHDTYELRCHFCGARYPVPSKCSACGSFEIKMRSYGTKAITEELTRLFPDVIIKRFDTDTTKKDHLHQHTESVKDGSVQIVVGTQMIAKGLDLPKLRSLVVLSASSGNGYGGEERDFQLLYQVLGRATRGHQNTKVIIQTATPDAKVIQDASNRDYSTFYARELIERKAFFYPPYYHMMVVHISRKTAKGAASAGLAVQKKISSTHSGVSVSSAMPDITERIGTQYNWHLLVKSPKRSRLVDIAIDLGTGYLCELDPIDTP
jgi:primosomal protein N' (replication factor Y)